MTRIALPFGVQHYQHRHRGAGSSVAINMMPAAQAPGGAAPIVMQKVDPFDEYLASDALGDGATGPFPSGGQFNDGLEIAVRVRGMRAIGAHLYVVVDGSVLKQGATGGATPSSGAAIAGTGRVWMEHNGTQLVIVNNLGNGYVVTLSTMVVAQIADPDFPLVSWVQFLDQYFLFGVKGESRIIASALADPLTYDALDTASAETNPDPLLAGLRDHRDLLLFGTETTEFWYNNEAATGLPFARAPDGAIEVGIGAVHSLGRLDNAPVFLAVERGGRSIRRLEGRTAVRISTAALDDELDSYQTIDDAFAMTWQFGGHSFYAITFPTVGRTWVYDAATNLWHRRRSNGTQFWRCGATEMYLGRVVGMDLYDLIIRYMSRGRPSNTSGVFDIAYDQHTDIDGLPISWEVVTVPVATDRRPTTFNRVELAVDTGTIAYDTVANLGDSPGQVFLSWSDDDGRTWSNKYGRSLGRIGEYNRVLSWTNLGMTSTGRVFKFSGGARCLEAIHGAFAEITVGK